MQSTDNSSGLPGWAMLHVSVATILAGAYLGPATPGRSRSRSRRIRGPAVERPERVKFDVAGKVWRLRKGVAK